MILPSYRNKTLCNEIFCTKVDLNQHKKTVHEGVDSLTIRKSLLKVKYEIEYQLKKFSIHLNRIAFQII